MEILLVGVGLAEAERSQMLYENTCFIYLFLFLHYIAKTYMRIHLRCPAEQAKVSLHILLHIVCK